MEILKKSYVKHAFAMSAILAGCLGLMELTGQNDTFDNKSPIQMFFMFIAPAIIWWMGMVTKKKAQKNKITYKEAFNEGVKISVAYAVISPFIFAVYYGAVNPGILSYVRNAYGIPNASDLTIVAIDMAAQFVAATIFGTIYAAILAVFVKTSTSKKKGRSK